MSLTHMIKFFFMRDCITRSVLGMFVDQPESEANSGNRRKEVTLMVMGQQRCAELKNKIPKNKTEKRSYMAPG